MNAECSAKIVNSRHGAWGDHERVNGEAAVKKARRTSSLHNKAEIQGVARMAFSDPEYRDKLQARLNERRAPHIEQF
jgi:hypothetical protein